MPQFPDMYVRQNLHATKPPLEMNCFNAVFSHFCSLPSANDLTVRNY